MICQAMWLVNFKQYSHLADEITLFVQSRCERLSVRNGMKAEPLWADLRTEWVNASPRGQCSKQIQNLEGKAYSDERKQCQSPGRMKNSSYYIAPVGVRTNDLPHTIASNMGKVSYALTHSATAAERVRAVVCLWCFQR